MSQIDTDLPDSPGGGPSAEERIVAALTSALSEASKALDALRKAAEERTPGEPWSLPDLRPGDADPDALAKAITLPFYFLIPDEALAVDIAAAGRLAAVRAREYLAGGQGDTYAKSRAEGANPDA